jgi:25S rRNA (adenine2142-N1)-methyltransferase
MAKIKASPITGRPLKDARMKPKHTRKIIRRHHTLMKRKSYLEKQLSLDSDPQKRTSIRTEITDIQNTIHSNGGLIKYQLASIAGQESGRGGDTSKVLVEWLRSDLDHMHTTKRKSEPTIIRDKDSPRRIDRQRLSLLEIGCLSVTNACSTSGLFATIERIDLNSQHTQIKQQDFMQRPLPVWESDKFDVISLSLVLNYASTPAARGEMLCRTVTFLKSSGYHGHLPCLFLVLPSPCVKNSRYFTEQRLEDICTSLGYTVVERKDAKKLMYWLLKLTGEKQRQAPRFPKLLLNDGKSRNNFCVTV